MRWGRRISTGSAAPGAGRTWMSCGARGDGRGVTETALRPVGVVRLAGKCYEARAAGGVWLGAGVEVRVYRDRNGNLVAEEAKR